MVARQSSKGKTGRSAVGIMGIALLLGMWTWTARASGSGEIALDAPALTQLEQRAANADPRDQCFLYAEVVQGFTDLAGRQMAAGEDEQLSATIQHLDEVSAKLHAANGKNAKRIKNAELMVDQTTRHLADMVRVASASQRERLQRTLQHLNAIHSELLATVFAR